MSPITATTGTIQGRARDWQGTKGPGTKPTSSVWLKKMSTLILTISIL